MTKLTKVCTWFLKKPFNFRKKCINVNEKKTGKHEVDYTQTDNSEVKWSKYNGEMFVNKAAYRVHFN